MVISTMIEMLTRQDKEDEQELREQEDATWASYVPKEEGELDDNE